MAEDLYTIHDFEPGENAVKSVISFHKDHPVFAGHFPGKPIVPGVYLLEILRDAISKLKKKEFQTTEASSIKYLQVINPADHPEILLSITIVEESEEKIKIDAVFTHNETTFAKFKSLKLEDSGNVMV